MGTQFKHLLHTNFILFGCADDKSKSNLDHNYDNKTLKICLNKNISDFHGKEIDFKFHTLYWLFFFTIKS